MRWQIALPDADTLGLLQNFTNFLDRKEFRDYAETDVIGNPAASRQGGDGLPITSVSA